MKKSFLDIQIEDVDKPSRIKRLFDNVFKNGITDITKMEDIPLLIRAKLQTEYQILSVKENTRKISKDGCVKFLFELQDGLYIESVLLVDKNNRVTLCISSQVGCRMACSFCKTAQMGLLRSLSYHEIVSQVIFMFSFMKTDLNIHTKIFNIVYMGMGEPLDNLDNVVKSLEILTDKNCFFLHASWITVSTCGLMDKVPILLEHFPRLRVAISLNSAIQSDRKTIMPVSNAFPVDSIHATLMNIYSLYKRRLLLEYVLIPGINDRDCDIDALELFNHKAFHINIIPLNTSDVSSKKEDILYAMEFIDKLMKRGFFVTRRIRRGYDISADCGQLFLEHQL